MTNLESNHLQPNTSEAGGSRGGHSRLHLAIGAGVLASAIAAGGYFATKSGESNPAPDRNRDPVATAPATPGETEVAEPTVESDYEPTAFSAEKYTTGEELATAFYDERNKWMMSGVNIQNQVDWADFETSITQIAHRYDEKYIDSLLVDDWESNSELYEMVTDYQERHRSVLYTSIMTTDSTKPEDIEPYRESRDMTSVEVIESTPEQIIVDSRFIASSNSEMNRGDLYVENVNGKEGGTTITFVLEGDTWKISDLAYYGG